MKPPCIWLNEVVFPAVRREVSIGLSSHGFKQVDIADKLGITQAMVSKYLTGGGSSLKDMEMVDSFADIVVSQILSGSSEAELAETFCKQCFAIKESANMCGPHGLNECSFCLNLRTYDEAGDRRDVINDIDVAFQELQAMDLTLCFPEVRLNIAMAAPDATGIMDVAAYPGRLTLVEGRLASVSPPKFGGSNYMAGILVRIIRISGSKALINLKLTPGLRKAVAASGLTSTLLTLDEEADVYFEAEEMGREPQAYIVGTGARDAAEKIGCILKNMGE